ncbi:glycosyltransferase family protein [Marinobacter similis]|uniref:Glycosyltransferase 2-like domain-containing protein n=1 Tax=Marinobacter similis TaxID=1420916 RepID=W5YM65_9GAMM|nr:hypothetical protein [Marinobacter similis]AHI30130.1 hypothetical protein AU14_12625 [Marinobacter similis]
MKTTGELVFLSDQDDAWFPNKIEYMQGIAEQNPNALVLMNDAALTDGHLNEVGLTKIGQIQSAGFRMEDFVMGCCCAVRRELLDICMPIPMGFRAHDNWLVEIAEGLDAKLVERRVLQYYRRHEANESQFAANSITRVSRIGAFFHSAKKIFDPEVALIEQRKIEQLKIFSKGIDNIKKNAPREFTTKLCRLRKAVAMRSNWMEKRVEIRQRSIVPRTVSVIRLLKRGEYATYGGFKAFLRDLVG